MKKITLLLLSLTTLCAFANTTTWMSQIPSDHVFNQLVIPGTHDSGTYAIQPQSQFSLSTDDALPTWIEQISNILPASMIRPIIAGWSKTQPYTISQQLNAGIRYLDFRAGIFPTDGHFYLSHTLISVRLNDALQQIQQFIAANPSEIVIVDINHVFNVTTSAQETQLVTLLQTYLGQYAIPNTDHPTDTIGTLRAHGNVIIVMDMNQPVSDTVAAFAAHAIWHESAMNSPWPNQSTIPTLQTSIATEMAAHEKLTTHTHFFVLQGIQTEGATQVINGILAPSSYPNTIQGYETPLNPTVYSWEKQYNGEENIVIQDWFDSTSQLVADAIQYDTQSATLTTPKISLETQEKLAELKTWYAQRQQ